MLSFKQFFAMRPVMRALVYLYWIQSFVGSAVSVFAQIYLYQLFGSVQLNVVAALLNYTGIMIGFCIYGALMAQFKQNVRHGFLMSFVSTALGILLLTQIHTMIMACIVMTIVGLGGGFFWLTIHTYELVETRDHERDVYSTFLSAGGVIMLLAGPAYATLLIWIADSMGWGQLMLLFVTTPFIFLLGFLCFGELTDYRPKPIRWYDIVHFCTNRRNLSAQPYLFGGAAVNIIETAALPLVIFVILGTTLRVGGFNTGVAILSSIALLVVGAHRHAENRLLILGISSAITAVLYVFIGFSMTFAALIIAAIGFSIFKPMMRVSQHVIDLQTMDSIGHKDSDFYPTMILRDFSLWIWRVVTCIILIAVVVFARNDVQALSIFMYLTGGTYIITYLGARFLLAAQPAV
jgi:MFS family permease